MRALAAWLGLLLLAPLTMAHHTGSPVLTDPPGDAGAAGAWGDITEGWVHDEGDHLEFVLTLAQLPDQPIGDTWVMTFASGNGTMAVGAFQDPGAGLRFFLAPWDPATGPTGPVKPLEGKKEPGTPGSMNITVPLAALNLTASSVLGKVGAATGFCACLQGAPVQPPSAMQAFDTAVGEDWKMPAAANNTPANTTSPLPPPAPVRTPDSGVVVVVTLLAVVALAARRR
jgi:hypothetical protein